MRAYRLHTFLFSLLFLCASAQALDFPRPVKPGEEAWRKPFKAALEKKISGDAKKSFPEIVDWFREQGGVTIVVDPAIKDASVVTLASKDLAMGQVLKQVLTPLNLQYEVRDMAIFIFNPKTLDKSMLTPDDMHVGRMLEGRAEVLSFEPANMLAGEALKELTETPGIKLAVDESLKKVPVTFRLKEIGLGYAIRWTVRFAGGKIIVDRDGMKMVKR